MQRRLHIRIRGASPYGFRLAGGRGQPVLITKLRARSKAAEAGLLDGDEVIAVNGYSCSDVSYERLVGLVEHAGHYLDLDIIRRTTAEAPVFGPRDWKLSYNNRLDDVIATSPASFDNFRRQSPPTFDFSKFLKLQAARSRFSPVDFDDEFAGGGVQTDAVLRPQSPRTQWNGSGRQQDVSVVWNPDKSITMSLSMDDDSDSKENRFPAFHGNQQQQPRHRNESFMMIGSPRVISPTPSSPSSRSLAHHVWKPRPITPPPPQRSATSAADVWLTQPTPARDLNKFGSLPPDVLKIITPPNDAESLDSLSPHHLTKRKKFADSSFYDDKSQNYPTVEQQMKMARRVAQSLTAPANQATRGHRMFMKHKEKSVNWTVDETNRRRSSFDSRCEDLYYNPAPWKTTTTWKPKQPADFPSVTSLPPTPQLLAPRVPPVASDEKAKYMSADEFERMRLFEDKTTHDTVDPQLCFNLAADLRQSTSKGGRMFARRRAKADQWTVENDPLPEVRFPPTVNTSVVPAPQSPEPDYDEVMWLSEPEDVPRGALTPWQAAELYGHVEPAFQHLQQFRLSPSIPHQSTSSHSPQNNYRTASDLSSTHSDSNHLSVGERNDTGQQSPYNRHQQQDKHVSRATSSPWQHDVTRTHNAGYRPVQFDHHG